VSTVSRGPGVWGSAGSSPSAARAKSRPHTHSEHRRAMKMATILRGQEDTLASVSFFIRGGSHSRPARDRLKCTMSPAQEYSASMGHYQRRITRYIHCTASSQLRVTCELTDSAVTQASFPSNATQRTHARNVTNAADATTASILALCPFASTASVAYFLAFAACFCVGWKQGRNQNFSVMGAS